MNTGLRYCSLGLGAFISVVCAYELWNRSTAAPYSAVLARSAPATSLADDDAGSPSISVASPRASAQPPVALSSPPNAKSSTTSDRPYRRLGWKDLGMLNPATGAMPQALRQALDGPVMVPGFIVPFIEDAGETLDKFLLVPEPMMCVHVPAPPPEYLVQVTMRAPTPYPEGFHPYRAYWARGILKVSKVESEIAEAAYAMIADDLLPYQDDSDTAPDSSAAP